MSNTREKFIELAEKRANKTIRDIRLIGNLSNRSNYKYTEEDVREVFSTLEKELKKARERFSVSASSEDVPFKFSR